MFIFYRWYRSLCAKTSKEPIQRGGANQYTHLHIMGFHGCRYFMAATEYAKALDPNKLKIESYSRKVFIDKLNNLKNDHAEITQHKTCPVVWLDNVDDKKIFEFIGGNNALRNISIENLKSMLSI